MPTPAARLTPFPPYRNHIPIGLASRAGKQEWPPDWAETENKAAYGRPGAIWTAAGCLIHSSEQGLDRDEVGDECALRLRAMEPNLARRRLSRLAPGLAGPRHGPVRRWRSRSTRAGIRVDWPTASTTANMAQVGAPYFNDDLEANGPWCFHASNSKISFQEDSADDDGVRI